MSNQPHCSPRRRLRHCRRDYYYLPASRDRLCARATQQDRADSASCRTPCGRHYLRPEFSLVGSLSDLTQWSALAVYEKTY
jgi:hypothetical protein